MVNLELMKKRAQYNGGTNSIDRMVGDKKRTLERVLANSYQSEDVIIDGSTIKVLFNDKGNPADEKVLQTVSALFNENLFNGALIQKQRDKSQWLLYQQDDNEKAYFRSYAVKCSEYTIKVNGTSYDSIVAKIIGPNEGDLNQRIKNSTTFDESKDFTKIWVPKTSVNLELFKRYGILEISSRTWEIASIDDISTPGVLQISAKEQYDDIAHVPIDSVPNTISNGINGPDSIDPFVKVTFTPEIVTDEATWEVVGSYVVTDLASHEALTISYENLSSGVISISYKSKEGMTLAERTVEVNSFL